MRSSFFILACALFLLSCAHTQHWASHNPHHEENIPIYLEAQAIRVNKQFINAPANEVLQFLQFDKSHREIPIGFLASVGVGQRPLITVDWDNVSWLDALDDFCSRCNLVWKPEISSIEPKGYFFVTTRANNSKPQVIHVIED